MARLTFGGGVAGMKGSIGGTTFQTNSAGAFARQRPYVKKSSSLKQQVSHQSHQNLLYQYSLLIPDDKDAWNTFAAAHDKINKFGQTKTLTGANWFLSVNYMRLLTGESLLTSPPDYNLPTDAPVFTIDLTAGGISLEIDAEFSWSDMAVVVWTSTPTSRQKPSINQIRKYVEVFTTDPGTPVDITSAWETATGLSWTPLVNFPSANIFICLQVICISSGITSPLLCTSANTSEIVSYDADAQLYFDLCSPQPTDDRKNLYNDFIVGCKADGNYSEIDRMWIFAAEDEQNALISLVINGAGNLGDHTEIVGISSPAYVTDRGYTGNGSTSYLDTNYNPSADHVKYTQNSGSHGTYTRTDVNESKVDLGISGDIEIASRWSNVFYSMVNQPEFGVSNSDSRGFFCCERTASILQTAYKNGSSVGTNVGSSHALANTNIFICAANNGSGSPSFMGTKQIAFSFIGSGAIDISALYGRVQTFMTAIGANV